MVLVASGFIQGNRFLTLACAILIGILRTHPAIVADFAKPRNVMPQINRHALVRHSAKRMYDLVNSVERYPDWFAWCTASEILQQSESEMRASLELRVAGIRSRFTTHNLLSPTHRIQLNLEEGAFKYLRGEWIFHALAEDACKVTLQLDFETSSLLAPAFAMGFQGLADKMVDDFCRQADRDD